MNDKSYIIALPSLPLAVVKEAFRLNTNLIISSENLSYHGVFLSNTPCKLTITSLIVFCLMY